MRGNLRRSVRAQSTSSRAALPNSQGAARPAVYFGYWLVAAAFVTQFVAVGVTNYAAGPFLTPMTEELGWSYAEFTIPRSLGGAVMALTGFLIGAWVDRYGGRRFMIVGVLVSAVALWRLGTTGTLLEWIVLNGVLLTIGAALFGNLVVNVTLAKWFVERRGQAVAVAAMGVSFGGIGGTPAITWLVDVWGWRAAWEALAVATLVLGLPFALLMRRTPEDYGLRPDGRTAEEVAAGRAAAAQADYAGSLTRRQAMRSSAFYLLIVAFGLFVINIGVMLLQTVPYLTDAGYSRGVAAAMIVVASVPAMLAKPLWGHLIDRLATQATPGATSTRKRIGVQPLAAAGSALTGAALLVIVASIVGGSLAGLCVGFFLLGAGWGGMIPLQEVIWASFFGRRHLGAVRSAALPFSLIFGAGAPLAVSYYRDVVGNYDGAMLAVAVANLVAAGLIMVVRPPLRG